MTSVGHHWVGGDPNRLEPAPPTTLDELAARLREFRAEAGSPSFGELTQRIGAIRAGRGAAASIPGRVTVYDCFRDGRKRVDTTLIMDIVRALGANDAELHQWKHWCGRLSRPAQTEAIVSFRCGLPRPDSTFIGREAELEFARDSQRLLITGMGGAGKTRLAQQALTELHRSGRITDIITVDLRGTDNDLPAPPLAVVDSIERALEMVGSGISFSARVQAIAGRLAQRRIALLLDDVRTEHQVRMLLQWLRAVPVIMTSRAALELPSSVRMLNLPPWSTEDATTLLRVRVGAERVDAEPEAAAGIVDLTGGLPLAMALVSARIAQQPGWSMADHCEAMRRRSETAQFDSAVQSAIRGAYDALPSSSRRALRLLATQPCHHLSDEQFAALVGADVDDATDLIHQLEYFHCASRPAPGRIGLHVLVRSFAAGQSWEQDPQADRDEALLRLADHLLAEAWSAAEALYTGAVARSRNPHRSVVEMPGPEGNAWLRTEFGHLIDVARALADRHPQYINELTEAIGRFVHEQTTVEFAEAFFRESVLAAERLDASAQAVAYQYLSQTLVSSGNPEASAAVTALRAHATAADLPLLILSAINSTGIIAGRQGDLHAALESFADVIARSATISGAHMAGVVSRDNTAIALYRLGELERSVAQHWEAIREAAESTSVPIPVKALAYANLTDPLIALGDLTAAEEAARRALELAEGRSRKVTLHATAALATVQLKRGQTADALAALRRIQPQEDHIVESSQRATLLLVLGDALAAAGEPDAALEQWQRALKTAERASFTYEQARALQRLGNAMRDRDPAEAIALLERCVTLYGEAQGAEPARARHDLQQLRAG